MEAHTLAEVDVIVVGPYMEAVKEVVTGDDGGVDEGASQGSEGGDVSALAETVDEGVEWRNLGDGTEIVVYVYPSVATIAAEDGGDLFLVVWTGWIFEGEIALKRASIARSGGEVLAWSKS